LHALEVENNLSHIVGHGGHIESVVADDARHGEVYVDIELEVRCLYLQTVSVAAWINSTNWRGRLDLSESL